jgi:hypothetical protein
MGTKVSRKQLADGRHTRQTRLQRHRGYMFVKVRENVDGLGWYENPVGTLARLASKVHLETR